MQYEVKTSEEYLKALDSDWRKEKLETIRNLIKKYVPALQEGIEGSRSHNSTYD